MSHPNDALLTRFVFGEVDERTAVALAHHIDACPECEACVATLDPLTPAYAAVEDPVVPPDLTQAILAQERAPATAGPEAAIASGLLAAAGLVLVVAGDLGGFIVRGAAGLSAALTALGAFVSHLGGPLLKGGIPAISPALWASLALLLLVASVASVRTIEARRRA